MGPLEASLFAGLVAIGATVFIERWGGTVGGLVAALPSTIVPATWGLWSSSGEEGFRAAMAAVPFGMIVNAIFLQLWRVVPRRLGPGSSHARLVRTVGYTLAGWGCLALGSFVVLEGLSTLAPGWLVPLAVSLSVGILALGVRACLEGVPAPRGTRPVTLQILVARGLLAALAVGMAVVLGAAGLGIASGLFSVFPAIFLTTMVALWFSQGEAVPAGAIGPMMLGSASVSVYALLTTFTFPRWGPGAGALVAWLATVLGLSLPSFLWLLRRARHPRR